VRDLQDLNTGTRRRRGAELSRPSVDTLCAPTSEALRRNYTESGGTEPNRGGRLGWTISRIQQQEDRNAARDDNALCTRPSKAKVSDRRAALLAQQKPVGRRSRGDDQGFVQTVRSRR
jgi:hypothetical protein